MTAMSSFCSLSSFSRLVYDKIDQSCPHCVQYVEFFFFKLYIEMPVIQTKAAVGRASRSPKSLSLREVSFGHISYPITSWSRQSWRRWCLITGAVARTAICQTNLELTGHMSIHPVVSCSQSDQDDLVCSVQAVVAICWVEDGAECPSWVGTVWSLWQALVFFWWDSCFLHLNSKSLVSLFFRWAFFPREIRHLKLCAQWFWFSLKDPASIPCGALQGFQYNTTRLVSQQWEILSG